MEIINQNTEEYQYAKNRVKKIKGFYVHFTIYIVVNVMIVLGTYIDRPFTLESFLKFETFATALFWGIGLIAHAASVFGKDLIFDKNWEEKKIQEFMTKDKKSNR